MCQHLRTLDVNSRGYVFVEKLPDELLHEVIDVVFAEIESE